mgnify:CR=1 FL=1
MPDAFPEPGGWAANCPRSNMLRQHIRRVVTKLGVLIHAADEAIGRQTLPPFGNKPVNLRIELPRRIINPDRMFFGKDVSLGPGSFLIAHTHYPTATMQGPGSRRIRQSFDSKIVVGDRTTATGGLQLAAHERITIEEDVLFASNIHINDGLHGYETAEVPYKFQPISQIAPIRIKRGSWVGQNVVILPGVTIGENCIVGANSVVNQDVPDRCVAVGNPAKVVKRWDAKRREWVSSTGPLKKSANA